MRVTLIFIILWLTNSSGFAQVDSNSFSYQNLDTLITYDVELRTETGPGYARYYVNGEQVRKIVYDSYSKFWDNIGKCTPCYLKTYDTEDNLISESVQFTDCPVGDYREYYTNGTLKVNGQYKMNSTGNWKNIFDRGYCRKVGKWIYYASNGSILKIEEYVDGKLTK